MSSALEARQSSFIRLWSAEPAADDATGELSPDMRLSEFFEFYFLPIILGSHKDAAASTITLYRNALVWWKILTGDPPLSLVDDFTIGKFKSGLKTATFKRGPLSPLIAVKPHTQAKHLRAIRAVLHRVGPNVDPRRPSLNLIGRVPYVPIGTPHLDRPKDPYPLGDAQALAAACEEMHWPRRYRLHPPPKCPAALWMLGWIEGMYFTPLRAGTVLDLAWSMLTLDGDAAWLEVPSRIVHKTKKAVRQFVHPTLLATWTALRPFVANGKILGRPYGYDSLSDRHDELCELAGLPESRWLSPHAWRRTHADQIARVGYEHALNLAQKSLDHADGATTSEHYCDLLSMAIRRLPPLRTAAPGRADGQLKLF